MSTTLDPRERLLGVFRTLLVGPPYSFRINLAEEAIKSLEAFLNLRRSCGWSLPQGSNSVGLLRADNRLASYGRLYLDLALQLAKAKLQNRTVTYRDFASLSPSSQACDRTLLSAMRTELWHVGRTLLPQREGLAHKITNVVNALMQHSESVWPVNQAGLCGGEEGSEESRPATPLSHSIGNLAITYGAQSAGQSMANVTEEAEIAQLHVSLIDPGTQAEGISEGAFSVRFFPSLLSSLDLYSSLGAADANAGWWGTLDLAEEWATAEYQRAANLASQDRLLLRGRHLARWHVARSVRAQPGTDDEVCYSNVVSGSSHGAAFSLGLMQSIARAHAGWPLR